MVAVNWLVNDAPLSVKDQLKLAVLDHILMGSSAAFLYKRLVESNLGESVIGGGLDDTLLQYTFSAGLKGVKPADFSKVEALVSETLKVRWLLVRIWSRRLVEKVLVPPRCDGFRTVCVMDSPRTLLRPRSIRSSSLCGSSTRDPSLAACRSCSAPFSTGSTRYAFPYLMLVLGVLGLALTNHLLVPQRDPLDGLRFEGPLSELKSELASGGKVFEKAIEDLLLANGHRVTVEMTPDTTLEEKQQAAEAEKLAKIKASLGDKDLEEIIKVGDNRPT
jgi:presequence protease